MLVHFCSGNARNRTACRHRTVKATGLQPAVQKHSHHRKARDSNPERFHPQLHSKQCPHPAGYLPLRWSTGIEPASTWVTTKSLNQHSTTTAPGTGIEPATFWFRARRNHQQLLPRINQHPASKSNADKRGSKLHRCTSSRGVRAEGIEPIVLWLEARHSAIELRTQFQAEGARVELAGHCQCSAALEAAAITNWLALPYSAPAAGIEPA